MSFSFEKRSVLQVCCIQFLLSLLLQEGEAEGAVKELKNSPVPTRPDFFSM